MSSFLEAPAEFKSNKNMSTIRRKAMSSFLEDDKVKKQKKYGPQAPIIQPMRTGVPLSYELFTAPPLQSISKSLDPFRTMVGQGPHVSVEQLKFHCKYRCTQLESLTDINRFPVLWHARNGTALDSHGTQHTTRLPWYAVYGICTS